MYYIAVPKDDKYVIVLGQSFGIRSNAAKYAERMGWRDFFIATEEQRQIIESGQPFAGASVLGFGASVLGVGVTVIPSTEGPQEPDATWMKEEGIPWDKAGRSAQKKKNVSR